jgi:membrane protein
MADSVRRRLSQFQQRFSRSRYRLVWQAYRLWDRHDCIDLSAAFAYHTLQSIFPILLIALAVAGRILGRIDGLTDQLIDLADQILPASVVPLVATTLVKLVRQGLGAGVVGVLFLLISSTNAYLSLKRGADRLWGFRPVLQPPDHWTQPVVRFLRVRVEAVCLVLLIGFFVVIDQLTTSFRLLRPGSWRLQLQQQLPDHWHLWSPVPGLLDFGLSLLLAIGLAYGVLALLPSRRVPGSSYGPGALLIGSALTLLNAAVARSLLSLGSNFQAYGVIGGVLVLSLWVWLVALVLYFGIALTVVLTRRLPGGASALHSADSHPPLA